MRSFVHCALYLGALCSFLAAGAQAAPTTARRSSFKTTFASGARCTVGLCGQFKGKSGWGKPRPYRFDVRRTDGTRVIWNLRTRRVYSGKLQGKGARQSTERRGTLLRGKDKVMYLMRGLSGSGKSTEARKLAPAGNIMSTDDFFMNGGTYQFDVKKLGQAHAWNEVDPIFKPLLTRRKVGGGG